MIKKIMMAIAAFAFMGALNAQQADKVVGYWLTDGGESQIKIFKTEKGKYNGVIQWLEEPNEDGKPKLDKQNPDSKLQSRPIMGLPLLEGFKYDAKDEEWVDGTIYDPKSGKTYDCYMWFEDNNDELHVKGFIGFSLIGREVVWKRDSNSRK